MTPRVSRPHEEDPAGEADVRAAATSTAIADLRRRLWRDGIEHPSVRKELATLEDLLTDLFERAGRSGRHRHQESKKPDTQAVQETSDTEGSDQDTTAAP